MNPLRSLRNRLAIVFGLIVLGAIATVYLTTVAAAAGPADASRSSTASRPTRARAAPDARRARSRPAQEGETLGAPRGAAASRSSAEVLVLKPLEGKPTGLTLAEDSHDQRRRRVRRGEPARAGRRSRPASRR